MVLGGAQLPEDYGFREPAYSVEEHHRYRPDLPIGKAPLVVSYAALAAPEVGNNRMLPSAVRMAELIRSSKK